MQKFFSNRRLVIAVIILVICFGLMAGSVSLRNRRNTPPIIQQFGNDIVGFVDSAVALTDKCEFNKWVDEYLF